MKILFDHPKKSKWQIAKIQNGYSTSYHKATDRIKERAEFVRDNFIYEALLKYQSVYANYGYTYITLIDIDDQERVIMSGQQFTHLMNLVADDESPLFRFDGKHFTGRFTFTNTSGNIYTLPYIDFGEHHLY